MNNEDFILPKEYTLQKFYQYAGYPQHNKFADTHNASCPICKEDNGKYWGKRKRLYYFPDKDYLYCHNCLKSYTPYNFVKIITQMDYNEIMEDVKNGNYDTQVIKEENKTPKKNHILPHDSINIFDQSQLEYFKNDKTIIDCINFVSSRKIDISINKPKSLYKPNRLYT